MSALVGLITNGADAFLAFTVLVVVIFVFLVLTVDR